MGKKIRGVNLGGWLVLEKWMTPSLFEGLNATDETTWCVEMGDRAPERLRQHWDTFITEADFEWLSGVGINAVRIPVGFWLFGPPYPHHWKYGEKQSPFVEGGVERLDRAFEWAEKHGLLVLLDLHAAPGCQNGFDNGGLHGVMEWHMKQEYIEFALETLRRLAERYGKRNGLLGIEVLNEPRWDVPSDLLKDYTRKAYQIIRNFCSRNDGAVVFNDGFRSPEEYSGCFCEPEYSNVVLDIHRYQCFSDGDKNMDIYGHIQKAAIEWKNETDSLAKNPALWTYVGEWSLGLDLQEVSLWAQGPFPHALKGMDEFQQAVARRAYGAAQLASFERYMGWFFWSYKTETTPAWCFRECVNRGWLPSNYKF